MPCWTEWTHNHCFHAWPQSLELAGDWLSSIVNPQLGLSGRIKTTRNNCFVITCWKNIFRGLQPNQYPTWNQKWSIQKSVRHSRHLWTLPDLQGVFISQAKESSDWICSQSPAFNFEFSERISIASGVCDWHAFTYFQAHTSGTKLTFKTILSTKIQILEHFNYEADTWSQTSFNCPWYVSILEFKHNPINLFSNTTTN